MGLLAPTLALVALYRVRMTVLASSGWSSLRVLTVKLWVVPGESPAAKVSWPLALS